LDELEGQLLFLLIVSLVCHIGASASLFFIISKTKDSFFYLAFGVLGHWHFFFTWSESDFARFMRSYAGLCIVTYVLTLAFGVYCVIVTLNKQNNLAQANPAGRNARNRYVPMYVSCAIASGVFYLLSFYMWIGGLYGG